MFVASRRLPTLRLIRERRVLASGYGESVFCRDRAGSIALATIAQYVSPEPRTRLLRVTPIGVRTLEVARELSVAIHGDSAFVSSANGRLVVRSLRTGARRFVVGTGEVLRALSVSPDGRRLAGFAAQTLVLVDVRARALRRVPKQPSSRSSATWISADRLVVAGSGRLETLDVGLRPVAPQLTWPAHTTAVTPRQRLRRRLAGRSPDGPRGRDSPPRPALQPGGHGARAALALPVSASSSTVSSSSRPARIPPGSRPCPRTSARGLSPTRPSSRSSCPGEAAAGSRPRRP